jgi:N6-L-threonylcarbamoyladenine synthase
MKILAIETSCDETAIAVVEAAGDEKSASFTVRGDALLSQIEVHKEYGGVYPSLAKREHAKNLVPLLSAALEEAELLHEDTQVISDEMRKKIGDILSREQGLADAFFEFVSECEPPAVDAIAVTAGPGLEPALWVGISFAKALSLLWDKPLVAVNHMEGHILSALAAREGDRIRIAEVELPVVALLISGGHTELMLMKEWLSYERLGQTRDDAVGEAFDKAARMLGLPYPGGPEISKLAETARGEETERQFTLPRPMIDSNTCDFSFAGLKTAVLYLLKDKPDLNEKEKRHLAREFEDAVAEVLWKKTGQALAATQAKTLVVGCGVSANAHIRRTFRESCTHEFPDVALRIPAASLTTDNAVMIALAGYYRALRKEFSTDVKANGNLALA